jgi:hypothetical protein
VRCSRCDSDIPCLRNVFALLIEGPVRAAVRWFAPRSKAVEETR